MWSKIIDSNKISQKVYRTYQMSFTIGKNVDFFDLGPIWPVFEILSIFFFFSVNYNNFKTILKSFR